MSNVNECLAIVMAAGEAKRFGQRKLYQRLGDKALIDYVLETLATIDFKQVIVVVQPGDELVTEFMVVENPLFAKGQSTSIKAGLKAARNFAGVFFCPADQPFLKGELFQQMAERLEPGKIIIPRHEGRNGSPTLFSTTFLEELLSLEGEEGGRPIIRRHPEAVDYLDLEDGWMLYDIDTLEDFQRAEKRVREESPKSKDERDTLKP